MKLIMENLDVIIIGAGISGLAAAVFIQRQRPDLRVRMVDGADRVGGAIASHHCQGYLIESGPHGFLDNKEDSQLLLSTIGLVDKVQKAPLADFKRFICRHGRLIALPQKPQQLLTTPLLRAMGKIRLLGDLFKPAMVGEPTVAQWAEYRFGKGVLPMVDAAITGTFSGDYQRLKIDAVMPGVRRLEKEFGSVLKGLRGKARQGQGGGHLPAMSNFLTGMETLPQGLKVGQDIQLRSLVRQVTRDDLGWRVALADETLCAPQLVMALPINSSLALLADWQPPAVKVPESYIVNVALGFADTGVIPKGFGYLAPECEDRFALGCMFTSWMFPGRAPQGKILLEALVGGRRHPERLALSDDELIRRVWADMAELLDLPDQPEFAQVWRPVGGIPQQEDDHLSLLSWRRELEARNQGLHVCGFGWDGIGINEMIKSARQAAEAVCGAGQGPDAPEVKPVYF